MRCSCKGSGILQIKVCGGLLVIIMLPLVAQSTQPASYVFTHFDVSGSVLADGGLKGEGESGGSIFIKAHRMTGSGMINAVGGHGFAGGGGGGGRVSIKAFSRRDDTYIFSHGGSELSSKVKSRSRSCSPHPKNN